ncbi:alpha/beta hydrolase [Streptomyces sp. SCA3-4]|uniref:alpha/beta hydrolase n=1 Tax=Streptomyces sichuanensis TaxID=2871810 RepID=UPI001CE3391C|nr:alpha/beta hydrolase [Streptomyces sichuanensis]MCA6091771.1 alpha/beta hydrolase [Streptomyces sichuanensis]
MTITAMGNERAGKGRSAGRRRVTAAAAVVLAALAAAPAVAAQPSAAGTPAHAAADAGRGALLRTERVAALDDKEVAAYLAPEFTDAPVRYGVRAYRLTYRTVTPQGRPTTATGLLVLPDGGGRRLAVVSDTHGTMASRTYAPSVIEGKGFGRLSPYLHAAAGRAVAAPDYLGLGNGPGRHPYMDTASAVTASVDMLRAARTAAQQQGRQLTGDVYATGFSQGGQVAVALARALDAGADRHFRLRALAPVSGPYDLEKAEMPGIVDGRVDERSAVFYLSYYLTAQNRLHPVYRDAAEVFRQPYAGVVDRLFDSRHTEEEIFKVLPATVRELLTDGFYERLQHPSGGLLEAMRAQDGACGWKPAAPVRLHTAAGDRDVPIANSVNCAGDFARHGVRVPVVDHGKTGHFGAFLKATPEIARWFDAVQRTP